jgi:hypothetical protein
MTAKAKKYALFLLVIAVALVAFTIIGQRHLKAKRKQWFREWSEHMDATLRSNGLVNVGGNSWELPDRRATNVSGTNRNSN